MDEAEAILEKDHFSNTMLPSGAPTARAANMDIPIQAIILADRLWSIS